MSMYTQLLDAALGQRLAPEPDAPKHRAVAKVRRCREQLDEGIPSGMDPDTVPIVLALQIGYDVALLQLAAVLGVETDPSRFEQPQSERARLEEAFSELGVSLEPVSEEQKGNGNGP